MKSGLVIIKMTEPCSTALRKIVNTSVVKHIIDTVVMMITTIYLKECGLMLNKKN